MEIRQIHFNPKFESQFIKLPSKIQKKAEKCRKLLLANLLHPSLRLHKLKGKMAGKWSISVDRKYRIIFRALDDGIILFISIGLHAIYED